MNFDSEHWGSFWRWLLKGTGAKSGISRVVSLWLVFDISIAIGLEHLVEASTSDIAQTVLLPLAGVFVGIAIAASSNAQTLLLSREMEKLSSIHKGGLEDFVFPFQLSILLLLATIIYWAICAFGAFDPRNSFATRTVVSTIEVLGFALTSLSIRSSWGALKGVAFMIFAIREVRRIERRENGEKGEIQPDVDEK